MQGLADLSTWCPFIKEPWDTPQRATTPKSCYPCKKNWTILKNSKNIEKQLKKKIHAFQNEFQNKKNAKKNIKKRNKFHKKKQLKYV